MALPYSHTLTVDVWRGRNNFLKQDDPSFAQDQRVTLSFGANTAAAPAEIYGPWPRNYLLQFFPFLRSPLLFQRPAGVTDAVWATMTVPENFDGAEHQFKPDVFRPIMAYLDSENLLEFKWPDPNGPIMVGRTVDMRDTWILADYLQGHAIKNAIADHFVNHTSTDINSAAYFEGHLYNIDRELIDYCFENKLWTTQFGRAILYITRKEIEEVAFNVNNNTPDTEVLPAFLETVLDGAAQDFNYLPWYYELLRMILIQQVRPFSAVVAPESNNDSVRHFCGIAHHHPNQERCTNNMELSSSSSSSSNNGSNNGDDINDAPAPREDEDDDLMI